MAQKEITLLEGCRKGNGADQRELFKLYYSKLMGICLRFAKNADEAKDLLQEGFIKIFDGIDKFQGNSSLETWMKRIMINHCINYYKKELRQIVTANIEDYDVADEEVSLGEEQQQYTPEQVLEIMKELPLGYKTVLNLYAVEGFTHKEIATTLNISEGTSKSQLNKARTYLKSILSERLIKTN
jgi:RNA polymerase sigma-70 factor (ECF subfamily)